MSETVPFGKYRGRPVEDMLADAEYMTWLEAQPWFRERFLHLLSRRDAEAANRTPVHNRLQTLFLEEAYVAAFQHVASPNWWSQLLARGVDLRGSREYREIKVVAFEIGGADVLIRSACAASDTSEEQIEFFRQGGSGFLTKTWRIEIKPTVADDYPAVLRQMARNRSDHLFVGSYQGQGATEDQFVRIFAASEKRVIFKRDVDAALAGDAA